MQALAWIVFMGLLVAYFSDMLQDRHNPNRTLETRFGDDGVREKDGVELRILYQTSTNAVRQDFQALIKQWWAEIGIETEERSVQEIAMDLYHELEKT
mgnify:CR=1 FL=1